MHLQYKIAASIFWLAFCLSAFWHEIPLALIFGIGFGATIWMKSWGPPPGITQRAILLIYGSFALIAIGLILGFQISGYPLLCAFFAAGFFASSIVGRIRADNDSAAKEPPTPESDTGDT